MVRVKALPKEWHQCSKCPARYKQKQSLHRHKKSNCGLNKYNFMKCRKIFSRIDSLNDHIRKCKGIRELKCKVCNKEFKYEWHTQVI